MLEQNTKWSVSSSEKYEHFKLKLEIATDACSVFFFLHKFFHFGIYGVFGANSTNRIFYIWNFEVSLAPNSLHSQYQIIYIYLHLTTFSLFVNNFWTNAYKLFIWYGGWWLRNAEYAQNAWSTDGQINIWL